MTPRAVFLIGFMGAGKTSVGRALAHRLGWRFLDLDDVIESRTGQKIARIFQEAGEAEFRRAEASALRQVLAQMRGEPLVLALGGGAFVQPENARRIKEAGALVVFLDAALEELYRRCAPKAGQRPLLQDENQFRQLYESRRHAYMEADIRVETTGLSVEEAARQVARQLGFDAAGVEQNG